MKKTLSVLLSVIMAFSAFSVMPFSAFAAEEYEVWVGGTRVTSDNKNNIPAAEGYEQYSGTASYDPSTETLTLNNYIYKGSGNFTESDQIRIGAVFTYTNNTLTIILKGNNSIIVTGTDVNGSSYGIRAGSGSVTFKGDGALYVESADVGSTGFSVSVGAYRNLNIEGGNITAVAKKARFSYGLRSSGDSINISGGRVSAVAGEAGYKSSGMCSSSGISVGANAEYIEASGYSKAIDHVNKNMPVSAQLTGTGWTDTAGTEGEGFIAPGEYTDTDLSSYKKVVFPAVPDGQMGDNVYYKVVGKTAYIYGSGDMWDYDDDANTSPFYEDCLGVDEIVILEGITGIGDYAFFAVPIVSVSFPSTLKTIGDYAFSTTNLTAILIPEGVTDIGQYAFQNTHTELIFIPSTVTTIPKEAFSGAHRLTALILDRSLEFIAYNAFNGCDNLTDIYFYGCSSLNGPNFNSDDGNEPIYNATWHYIQEGEFGEHILLLSNSSGGDVGSVATVMVPGDKRGEKVHLTVENGGIFDGDVDITKYSSALDYSSAVVDLGLLTPGSHGATASYTDENNNKYTVSGQIDAGKWSPHIEVDDVEVLFGEDATVIMKGEEDTTGVAEFTFGDETYIASIKDGTAVINLSGIGIGEHPIKIEYSGDDNYLSETVTAKITVKAPNTVTPKTATIVYGEAAPTEVEVSYTDGNGNDIAGLPEKLPCTSSYTQYGNVGEYTISLDTDKIKQQGIFDAYEQAGYGFFEFDFTATSVLTVTKAPLTITANKKEYTYNGYDQGPGDTAYDDVQEIAELITVEGLKGTDAVTSIIVDGQGKNADTYELVPQSATVNGKTEAQGNYNITYVNGVLKINPKPLNITVFGQETYARYNGTEQSYTGTVLCTADPEFDFSKFSYTGNTTVKGTNAGDYEIKPSVAACKYSDTNYTINWSVGSPIRLTITQCALDITADDKETNHGSDLAELTYTIDNLHSCYYNEDELNISISTNADKNKPGTYDITVSCEDNPNYAVRTFSGTYTVGDSPHYYGTQGDERFTCTVCGAVDDDLKAQAEAADKAAAEAKAAREKAKAEFIAGVDGESTDSSVIVKWGKVPNAKRYVIYAAYCDKNHKYKYKKIKTVSGKVTKYEIKKLYGKKLNPKKNVKVYIVAQKKKNGKWKKIFKTPTFHIAGAKGKFSNVQKITVKKNKFTLNTGKTAKIKAEIVLVDKSKKAVNHVAKFRYRSTNSAVVKVTKNGKIKAVGKGKATVFVYSNNGTAKAIKVTVK